MESEKQNKQTKKKPFSERNTLKWKFNLKKKIKDKNFYEKFPCLYKIEQIKQQNVTLFQVLQGNDIGKIKLIYLA